MARSPTAMIFSTEDNGNSCYHQRPGFRNPILAFPWAHTWSVNDTWQQRGKKWIMKTTNSSTLSHTNSLYSPVNGCCSTFSFFHWKKKKNCIDLSFRWAGWVGKKWHLEGLRSDQIKHPHQRWSRPPLLVGSPHLEPQ